MMKLVLSGRAPLMAKDEPCRWWYWRNTRRQEAEVGDVAAVQRHLDDLFVDHDFTLFSVLPSVDQRGGSGDLYLFRPSPF